MGVFLGCSVAITSSAGLPHARGGVSKPKNDDGCFKLSSPRPWGCFRVSRDYDCAYRVFPTPVGVFLDCWLHGDGLCRLPHARGGVSEVGGDKGYGDLSSPRPWGCFQGIGKSVYHEPVFPTPVGVFLSVPCATSSIGGLPHARGGVSLNPITRTGDDMSSPRPWGCFLIWLIDPLDFCVFPTPVGVFPE